MRVLPYGHAAVLFEADPAQIRALAAALGRRPPDGAVDVVPAERTVLVRVSPGTDLAAVSAYVLGLDPSAADGPAGPTETVSIPVTYDGADLDRVAELTGLGVAGVVQAHTSTAWTVAFCGFAPGFAYLTGSDKRLAVPRRDSPRARGAGRLGGARRVLQRRLPGRVAGRMAADRAH